MSDVKIKEIFSFVKDSLTKQIGLNTGMGDARAVVNTLGETRRHELLAKILSTCLGLAVSFSITYFGVKWLVKAMDPTRQEKQQAQMRAEKLMKTIGVSGDVKLTEYELCIASNLVDPLALVVSWEDIGGLDDVVEEIQETVILPFREKELVSDSNLIQPPKGVLLYGPPGCGKTMIAKATAKAAGACFINLQVSSLVDKWYGESQKRSEAVFSLALKLQPTIIFVDEIDSFLRTRNSSDHEATIMMKTQFMSFWDGLVTDPTCRVMIIGATNRPQDVDAAILRRMPSMFYVGLPACRPRRHILDIILLNEPIDDDLDIQSIAESSNGFSGSDLWELCRNAAIYRLRDYSKEKHNNTNRETDESCKKSLRPIKMKDFNRAFEKMKTGRIPTLAKMQPVEID